MKKILAVFIPVFMLFFIISGRTFSQEAISDKKPDTGLQVEELLNKWNSSNGTVRALAKSLLAADKNIRSPALKRMDSLDIRSKEELIPFLISALSCSYGDKENKEVNACAVYALTRMSYNTKGFAFKLIDSLKNGDPYIRSNSALVLSRMSPPVKDAIPGLFKNLGDDNPVVKYWSAYAINEIVPDSKIYVPLLVSNLESKDQKLICVTVEILGKMGIKATDAVINLKELMCRVVTGNFNEVRAASAEALKKIGFAGSREAIHALVENTDYNCPGSEYAVKALEELGPAAKDEVSALLGIFKQADIKKYVNAVRVLGSIGKESSRAVPFLIKLLPSGESSCRKQVAAALGEIRANPAEAIPALIKTIDDLDADVGVASIVALSKFGAPAKDAVPALELAMKNKYYLVRVHAASALIKLEPKLAEDAVYTLVRVMTDKQAFDDPDRSSAIMELSNIKPVPVPSIPFLIQIIKNENYQLGGFAVEALGKMGPALKEVIPLLIEYLKLKQDYVSIGSVKALGNYGPYAKEAVPALLEALKIDEYCLDAAIALLKIDPKGGKKAFAVIIETLNGERQPKADENTVKNLVDFLGEMGPAALETAPALKDLFITSAEKQRQYILKAIKKITGSEFIF